MALTYKEVAEILKIIDASQLDEVVIELEGVRLVVRRGSPHRANGPLPVELTARPNLGAQAQAESVVRATRSFGRTQANFGVAEGRVAVRAPMVGSFYRRPSPQDKLFVEVGQRVAKGQPLCLIEVMKLYTTIEAPIAGVVEAIAVEDGSPVEFDQLLFAINPA